MVVTDNQNASSPLFPPPNPPKLRGSVALSVVAPCFNEAAGLYQFYDRVSAVCARITPSYELVLIDDGSFDKTWEVLLSLASRDQKIMCLSLSRNHGHQLALSAGLFYCRGERVLIIDADLQDPPELLEEMMQLADEGHDVVYGTRRSRAGESGLKKITAYAFYRLLNVFTDREIPKDTGDFRLITRRVVDVLNAMPENHRFIRGMVSWAGFRQTALLYDRHPRSVGATKYTLRKMLAFALDAITSFSVKPLRLAFYAAFLLSGISIMLLAYSVIAYFAFNTVRGWTSLIAVLLFFLSAQFLFLGLIGEYLGRMYLEVKRRPLYVVQSLIHSEALKE